jgi:hypothetical protein
MVKLCNFSINQRSGSNNCLWDPQNPEFKNKNARKDGLREIAAIFETDMGELEK